MTKMQPEMAVPSDRKRKSLNVAIAIGVMLLLIFMADCVDSELF